MQELGKFLILVGACLLGLGLLLYFSPALGKLPLLRYLGQLPGDIAVRRENFRFYFPLGTSLLLSVVLSLILYLFQRWRH